MTASTMQDVPLTVPFLWRHGARVHGASEVRTWSPEGTRRATFTAVTDRAERLAAALACLGVGRGDVVATFAWNTQEHLEAYLAVPSMGAVLHTLNIRLSADQLAYVANHAGDRVVIVDEPLVPVLAPVAPRLESVRAFVVTGGGTPGPLAEAARVPVLGYEALLAAEEPGVEWPSLDERDAAAMCYTSGTTGDPKGVVYSHRSTVLHAMAVNAAAVVGLTWSDRVLPIVPMFHVNAWGLPYAAWFAGADLVMPDRYLQAPHLVALIEAERPTVAGAVPTIWNDLLHHLEDRPADVSSLRLVVCGGAAVPRSLIEAFERRHGVRIVQGWGMTETSPLAAVAHPPRGVGAGSDAEFDWRARTGRVLGGVELRIVGEDGRALPWDDVAVGEIEVRGPWITGAYHREPDPAHFDGGWLRTGDVARVSPDGYVQITDRAKDVIKSGGEWISSVELEGLLMAHPDVHEAAVIGVPDERWGERPLACVVRVDGARVGPEELRAFLAERLARWQLPEQFAFVDEIPKTSVGKFDKKVLRSRHVEGRLEVTRVDG